MGKFLNCCEVDTYLLELQRLATKVQQEVEKRFNPYWSARSPFSKTKPTKVNYERAFRFGRLPYAKAHATRREVKSGAIQIFRPHNDRLSDHLRGLYKTRAGWFSVYSHDFQSPGVSDVGVACRRW